MTDDGRPFIPTAALSLLLFLKKTQTKRNLSQVLFAEKHTYKGLSDRFMYILSTVSFFMSKDMTTSAKSIIHHFLPPLLFLGDFRSRVNRLDISRYQEIIPHDF